MAAHHVRIKARVDDRMEEVRTWAHPMQGEAEESCLWRRRAVRRRAQRVVGFERSRRIRHIHLHAPSPDRRRRLRARWRGKMSRRKGSGPRSRWFSTSSTAAAVVCRQPVAANSREPNASCSGDARAAVKLRNGARALAHLRYDRRRGGRQRRDARCPSLRASVPTQRLEGRLSESPGDLTRRSRHL